MIDIDQVDRDYRQKIFWFIFSRLKSRAVAEDLCQDIIEKAYLSGDSYDPKKASIGTWLYTITRNKVIDFYRTQKPTEELVETIPWDKQVDDGILDLEIAHGLADAISKLPSELRKIIILRYYDEMPLTEIGKQFKLSYGQTKLRHNKALDLLKKTLSQNELY